METGPAQCREVEFPAKCKSAQAKKKHKEKTLKDHPDTLYADFIHLHGKRIKNNLIFHTAALSAWRTAICGHYRFTFKEGIGRGGRITVCTDDSLDTDNPLLTITYYTKGTVLVQGNEISLDSFQEIFPQLKTEVEKEAPSPALRESLALLELDFTEFKEYTQARLSNSATDSPIQQLKEEVQQLKRESQACITELRESLRELQQENHSLRTQITKLKEEGIIKERTLTTQLQDLREQLQNIGPCAPASTHTPSDPNDEKHTVTTTSNPISIDSSTHSVDSPEKAAHSDPPPDTQTPQSEPTPPQPPTVTPAESRPHVVLLMDSNRRFLDPQKLFPGHQVTARRCSTTSHAHQLLKKEALGCPQCIIIHTGTNDLQNHWTNTAEAVRKVAERASTEFPESRIVISTLLARSDTPPHVINSINAEISRGCATLPNVHLAHHPTITPRDMYDGLHLHKDSVRLFAKTLKDSALGRNAATTSFTPPAGTFRPPPQYMLSCWNIQGLHSSVFGLKSTDPEFLKNTVGVDIIILTETWCREDTPTHCPSGYCEVIVPSLKLSTVHRGRDSGGLLVWYRRDLADHISAVKLGKSHCWIKLNRLIGLSETDTFLCAVYTPPIESPYYDEEDVHTLHTEISHFQAQGNVLLCGDFNARTGSKLDYIDPQGNKHVFGQSSLYLTPTLRSRNNLDRTTNKSGKELVQLCRALGLYMLNGRVRGDSFGRFTYCSALGASVVDYAITDMDPSSFNAFTVRQQTPLSDHSQINVYLKWSHQPKHTAAESRNKCGIRIGDKHTEFFTQERGVRQGCSLSPTLFNIYINELAVQLEQSAAPGLTLQDGEVKFLLYADDLVLLSPSSQGLQQHLDLLEQYCQNWALAVNMKKTKVMVFQKKPRCQEQRYQFTLGRTALEHTMQYTYLGLVITASGSFSKAVNALKEKARRALYAIRRKFHNIDIPIPIWCKIFDSVIQPIALYGSEVWGPLSQHSYTRWDKHPTEVLHAEFCRLILKVQRKTPTNACRAELGRFPLLIHIQKRALKFWMHLKTSPRETLHCKALQNQELNPEKSPLSQLVLRLINPLTPPNTQQPRSSTALPPRLNTNQITKHSQTDYLEHWGREIQTQSKLECYRALKTQYGLEEYLLTVRDTKQRQILTKYRLSDHSLAIERGRYRQSWLPKEERRCGHCKTGFT
ncbi:hypothetical protein NFI96_003646 [Prochilodus magdalenae]|nr:hypothetical protein NFI96_003646 [Prochilodus magdalenae]